MKAPNKDAVRSTAEQLSGIEDAATINKWINLLEPVVDAGLDFELHGDAALLQPLMELRRANLNGYVAVMKAIDTARQQLGAARLGDRKGKQAYLADFMRVKRERETRIVNLWNEQFAEVDKLRGQARKDFMQMHAKRWNAERERRLEALRKQLGRALRREEQRVVIDQLLDDIDAELDLLERFVREELSKPLSKRSPTGFHFTVGKL